MKFEYLRENAHLRPRTSTISSIMRIRSTLFHASHMYFQNLGFHYISTPIITNSDCEGAGEMFQVTTLPIFSNSKYVESKVSLEEKEAREAKETHKVKLKLKSPELDNKSIEKSNYIIY